jgi:hypothetical protein
MKYRIVKRLINNQAVFTPQRKALFGWKDIEGYYRSDFTDMPGWMTTTWNSADDALKALLAEKNGGNALTIPVEIVFEE